MKNELIFRSLFDYETWTFTYLLGDKGTGEAVLIDPVKEQVARDLQLLRELGLTLKYVLDTHVHADHVTGAAKLKEATGALTGISRVAGVAGADLQLEDGTALSYGPYRLRVLATPGHTNSCLSFYSEGMVFTGDTLFVRDVGRTDFQEGSAERMYESIVGKLFRLPPDTRVYPAHDYRGHQQSTIAEEIAFNAKVGGGCDLTTFAARMAEMRLAPPKRLHLSVPANLKGGAD